MHPEIRARILREALANKRSSAAKILPTKIGNCELWLGSRFGSGRTLSAEEIEALPSDEFNAAIGEMLEGFPSWGKPERAAPLPTATERLQKANADSAKRAAVRDEARREPPLTPAEKAKVAGLDTRNKLSFANDKEFRDRFLGRKKH